MSSLSLTSVVAAVSLSLVSLTGCAVQASSEGTPVAGVELDTAVAPEAATFGDQCAAARGTYTGAACQCADGSFLNPYVKTCANEPPTPPSPADVCANKGGALVDGKCQCGSGTSAIVIDPAQRSCAPTFEESCATAGGVANAGKCECTGAEYLEPVVDPSTTKCQKIVRTNDAPTSIKVCGKQFALYWSPVVSGYGAKALTANPAFSGFTCSPYAGVNTPIGLQIGWEIEAGQIRCGKMPTMHNRGGACFSDITAMGDYLTNHCQCQ